MPALHELGGGDIARFPDDFAAGFESAFARFQVCVEEACAKAESWPAGVPAAIGAAFAFAAADPAAAKALTREALAAGPDGIARYQRLLAYLAELLAPGRDERPEGQWLPELTEQAVAGGLVGVAAERLARGQAAELPAMAPQAVQFVLTPYLGTSEAERIAAAGGGPDRGPGR